MTVTDLLNDLHQRGVRLVADGSNVRVRGVKSALTPDVLDAIREHKPELIAVLRAGGAGARVPTAMTQETPAAKALLERLLDVGATFEVIQDGAKDLLLWFGPAATVSREIQSQVGLYKDQIIALLHGGHCQSKRTWGEPTGEDWSRHPHFHETEP